eukprot:3523463-Pyramimonas_sp.AAC.1
MRGPRPASIWPSSDHVHRNRWVSPSTITWGGAREVQRTEMGPIEDALRGHVGQVQGQCVETRTKMWMTGMGGT